MIYRIGICDDEQLTCSELENYINEILNVKMMKLKYMCGTQVKR